MKARQISVLVANDSDINNWIHLNDQYKLKFMIENVQKTTFLSLYSINDNRYMVYWDKFFTEEWKVYKEVFLEVTC